MEICVLPLAEGRKAAGYVRVDANRVHERTHENSPRASQETKIIRCEKALIERCFLRTHGVVG
jgi:hypothetical protein